MKIISLFNNKGGVGKTTLAYHLSHCLSEMGKRVLMIDLDPQCNLTIYGLRDEVIQEIWEQEDDFIDDFQTAKNKMSGDEFRFVNNVPRTIHYLLKTTEEGVSDFEFLPPPVQLNENLHLIPGRLTMHMFEDKIAERWNGIYRGDPLSIRTVTKIRNLAEQYDEIYNYDLVVIDTSPSLGILNKVIISTVDGFLIPCLPDMFSLYGIRNIGDYLSKWKKEFDTIYGLISDEKRSNFPSEFVRFLGFTIYNAKKYNNGTEWGLAQAHNDFAMQIPETIEEYIQPEVREHLTDEMIKNPIGITAIMHTHNTFPNLAQKYKTPMWKIPTLLPNGLDEEEIPTVRGMRRQYEATKEKYELFSKDLLIRVSTLSE